MNKNLPFLIWLFFVPFSLISQQQIYLNQAKQISGDGWENIVIKKGPDSNYYTFVTLNMKYSDTVDIDPGSGYYPIISTSYQNSRRSFFCKYDKDLNLIDVKSMSGVPNSASYMGDSFDAVIYPKGLLFDKSGNIIYYGAFIGKVDFDLGPDTFYASSYETPFISKIDRNGKLLWVNTYNTGSDEDYFSAKLDSNENIICFGAFTGPVDMDAGPDTLIYNSIGPRDLFTWKLDSNGNILWVSVIGSDYSNHTHIMTIGPNGDIYLVGNHVVDIDADPGPDTFLIKHSGDLFAFNNLMVKLDKDGKFKWAHPYEEKAFPNSFIVDNDGKLYVSGFLYKNFDVDFTSDSTILDTANGGAFFTKMDPAGNLLLAYQNEIGGKLIKDHQNKIYLSGIAYTTADIEPGPGVELFSVTEPTQYIAQIDSLYKLQWVRKFFTRTNNNFYDYLIVYSKVINENEFIFSGFFNGTIKFPPPYNHTSLTSKGSADAFILKYSSNDNTNVNDLKSNTSFKIYPNPTSGKIYFDQSFQGELIITIYDITGKSISKKVINISEKQELEILGSPGIYFIEVLTEKGERQVFKVIKM